MRLKLKLMIASTRKTKRRILPISIDRPAIPYEPKSKATKARTKNVMDNRIMKTAKS